MKLKDLKQYLGARSREQLIAEIGEMFSKIDAVKDYYQSKLNLGYSAEVSEKYMSVIKREFFPTAALAGRGSPWRERLSAITRRFLPRNLARRR